MTNIVEEPVVVHLYGNGNVIVDREVLAESMGDLAALREQRILSDLPSGTLPSDRLAVVLAAAVYEERQSEA